MKKKLLPISLAASLGAVIIAGSFYVNSNNNKARAPFSSQADSLETVSSSVPSDLPQAAKELEQLPADTNDISLPILMYHHIRDYASDKDTIGTNLSVSLSSFKSHLDLISSRGYTPVTFSDLENGTLPKKPIILTFDDGYQNFYLNAYPELKVRQMKAVVFVITGSIGSASYMNKNELIEINRNGIEIGAHTITHPDLTKIDRQKARNEIYSAKVSLEETLEGKIFSFCYPAGKYSEPLKEEVRESGYKFAVTTLSGIAELKSPFDLRRQRVNRDTNISAYLP